MGGDALLVPLDDQALALLRGGGAAGDLRLGAQVHQEFVVAFEADDPGEFLDLVQELRPTESSAYTERETPIFTCVAMSVRRALDALDGAASPVAAVAPGAGVRSGASG